MHINGMFALFALTAAAIGLIFCSCAAASAANAPTAAWQRSFKSITIGDQTAPPNEMELPTGRASYNLAVLDGRVALLAVDHPDPTALADSYYATLLDGARGQTLNCVRIQANKGNNRVYRWPYWGVSGSSDTPHGFVFIRWDAESGILFTGQCGYDSGYTAYLPLANADSYAGSPQEGVPAFVELADRHPGFQDAFGRTRGQQRTIMGVGNEWQTLQPWAWGLTGFYHEPQPEGEKPSRYDSDWKSVFGRQGSSFYNTSAFFSLEADGPLAAIVKGAGWGHNQAGDAYLFNKHSGMKAVTTWPGEPSYDDVKKLRPFTSRGALLANGRLFLAGPSDDVNSNHELGTARPEGLLPRVDQGLALWAYDYEVADRQPNDGYAGPGAAETATLKPAFSYRLSSRYTPDPDDLDTYGQSYYETDGFYRPKAMLADGKSLWFSWKPSQAGPVELVHASDDGLRQMSLEVGRGAKGVNLWPKLALAQVAGARRLVYYTGWAKHRKRFRPDDVEAYLSQFTHRGKSWDELTDEQKQDNIRDIERAGGWTPELCPPRSPAQVAVVDPDSGEIQWTYDVSGNHPSLPVNGFWSYIDRSHMAVAGRWAYLGWVDTTGKKAVLRLLALETTAEVPQPQFSALPLGFAAAGNDGSTLMDLVAADGRLYAYVVQSENFWIRDPRFKAQHVLAVRVPQKGNWLAR